MSPDDIKLLEQIEKEAEKKLPFLRKSISTHNDLIFHNILVRRNGKISLLDFEYAGFSTKGGIFYDLGSLFAENLFDKPFITKPLFEKFLIQAESAYKRRFPRNIVYWAALSSIIVQLWWGTVRYFSAYTPAEKPYFKAYVRKRVRRTFELYHSITT